MSSSSPSISQGQLEIFLEGIDYSKTGKESIWGSGDKETVCLLETLRIHGKRLNLAAGDGRYNSLLLRKVADVIASDIDKSALQKLYETTPENLKKKLQIKQFDITKPFPLEGNSLDGVFCTGTLHLFSRQAIQHVFSEIQRVLKPGGQMIIDFATDIARVLPTGELYVKEHESQYSSQEAQEIFKELEKTYTLQVLQSTVPKEKVVIQNLVYMFSCNFFIVVATKK